MPATKPETIAAYVASFPAQTQKQLNDMIVAAKKAAPEASEAIKYAMPALVQEGTILVCMGGYKTHIAIYPAPPDDHPDFKEDLARYYTSGKGTVQFPLDKPVPKALVARIVKWNLARNQEKLAKKMPAKKAKE
jgi:uncharacterized protein YdhG (YjbR/CyaY superfamily)